MSADQSMYAPADERSWAQREADAADAMRLLTDVAGDAARREVLDGLGIQGPAPDWRRAVHQIRIEAALWRAQRAIEACDSVVAMTVPGNGSRESSDESIGSTEVAPS